MDIIIHYLLTTVGGRCPWPQFHAGLQQPPFRSVDALSARRIMDDYPRNSAISRRYDLLRPTLDERLRRLWTAAEALALGPGGVSVVAKATGVSRSTIRTGMKQLAGTASDSHGGLEPARTRRPGGGRRAAQFAGGIEQELEHLMDDADGDAQPLLWTWKSVRTLASELVWAGHQVSYRTVSNLLHRFGYRLGDRSDHKQFTVMERRAAYASLSQTVRERLAKQEPVLSTRVHGRGDCDASGVVAAALPSWWRHSGRLQYPQARRILLVSDPPSGEDWVDSASELSRRCDAEVTIAHLPPGTCRWRRSLREVTSHWALHCTHTEYQAMLDLVLAGVPPNTAMEP